MRRVLVLLLFVSILSGCSSSTSLMAPVEDDPKVTLSENQSAVIFLRPATLGYAVQSPVAEYIGDGQLKYIATVSSETKYLHITTPGKHEYLVAGEKGCIVRADLESGKFYYIYIDPMMGVWKARFDFKPVENPAVQKLSENFAKCKWYENTPEGFTWFMDNIPSFKEKYLWSIENGNIRIVSPEFGLNTLSP